MGKKYKKHNATLADGLRAWRDRPEGPIVSGQTNWTVTPANDNAAPEDIAGMRVNRRWSSRPTMGEIEAAIAGVDCEDVPHARYKAGKGNHETFRNPVRGAVTRNAAGQIISIGSLRFSDGSQTEKSYTHGPDGKLIMYDAPMPVGAMLNTKDAQGRMLGGDQAQSSNASYTEVYKARHPNKATRKPRGVAASTPLTKAQLRAVGKAAVESYGRPVKVYKTGFPWKPSKLNELFVGIEKAPRGESGSIAWQDISGHIIEREVWAKTLADIGDSAMETLGAAETARTLKDIAPGKRGGNAYRVAHVRLKAANDNLILAMKKNAA